MKYHFFEEPSKIEGYSALYAEDMQGNRRWIHSKYDPLTEARRWTDDSYEEGKQLYLVFGAGLLYHIEELIRRCDSSTHIIVIEPQQEAIDIMRKGRNVEILLNEQVLFLGNGTIREFSGFLRKKLREFNLETMKCITWKPYDSLYTEEYKELIHLVKDVINDNEFYFNTMDSFAYEHVDNIVHNIPYIAKSTFVEDFRLKFAGCPAVVVSAGPSLDKNIEQLKVMEDKVLIIAGGRTLRSLLGKGIRPHFVVSADPSYANFRLFDQVLDADVPLVTPWMNNKEIVSNYAGQKIFCNNTEAEGMDEVIFGRKIPDLYANGTVSTLQLEFARFLGCKNIALIGQDLCYTDGKNHADIAADMGQNRGSFIANIRVKGNVEEFVYTHEVFKHYLDIFEWYVDQTKEEIVVYNCTEGGAYIEGTKILPLKLFLEEQIKESRDFNREIAEILSVSSVKLRSREQIEEILFDMRKRALNSYRLSKKAKMILDNAVKEKRILTQKQQEHLRKADREISRKGNYNRLVEMLSVKTLNQIGSVEIDKGLDEKEYYLEHLKWQRAYYATLEGSYKVFMKILDDGIQKFSENRSDFE